MKESQSQLKRLKSALRDSGVAAPAHTKKKEPRKNKSDRERDLARIRERFNPYDVKVNKTKFDIGGRRVQGTQGRPQAAASAAEKMRRDTIGREKERKGRVGGLLDRRFGEGRADLTPDQIQLERYTKERQKSKKRNFSLEDDEFGLTHMGQSLEDMEDFGPAPVSDEEDMGAEVVSRTNFGNFEDLEENEIVDESGTKRKKTKDEIMHEIIAKSKQGKMERQRQADEDDEAREALDAELEDLQLLLKESEKSRPGAEDGINPDRLQVLEEDTEYDKAVKELIYDRRAQATDRTKTEEELIEEEAKRLQVQEQARLKRMAGEKSGQADDLSDDFDSGSEQDFGMGVNGVEEDDEDDEDDDDDAVDLNDDIELSESDGNNDNEAVADNDEDVPDTTSQLKFTYPCPDSLEALLSITSSLSETDIPTALHRIKVLHHPRLNPANNEKLSLYTEILVDYSLLPLPDSVITYVISQIHQLSQKYWERSTLKFLSILEQIRQRMYKRMSSPWSIYELKYFHLIGQIWSTPDAYHKVATPAFLVATQYLSQNSAEGSQAQAVKLMLCSILKAWIAESKRYIPEVITTLRRILDSTKPGEHKQLSLTDVTSADLHAAASSLVISYAELYKSLPGYIDAFSPFSGQPLLATSLRNATRQPLMLQSHRPIPIALHNPRFEESYNPDKKSYDPDTDRQNLSKLRRERNDMRRSTIRLLRRDAAFEAREASKSQKQKDTTYKQRIGKLENKLRSHDL